MYTFSDFFPYMLLQDIEYIALCDTLDPGWLSILYVCVCAQSRPTLCDPVDGS